MGHIGRIRPIGPICPIKLIVLQRSNRPKRHRRKVFFARKSHNPRRNPTPHGGGQRACAVILAAKIRTHHPTRIKRRVRADPDVGDAPAVWQFRSLGFSPSNPNACWPDAQARDLLRPHPPDEPVSVNARMHPLPANLSILKTTLSAFRRPLLTKHHTFRP